MTRRSFEKPRGYSGDAALLDLIYTFNHEAVAADPLAQGLYSFTFETAACRGVRHRRDRVTAELDRLLTDRPGTKVLSLAAGYLREAQRSACVARKQFSSYIALDADADAVQMIEREQGALGIEAVHASVQALIRGKLRLPRFDLIYCCGLYDYLSERMATAVTRILVDHLGEGGHLMIGQFAPSLPGIGYMEAFMDWFLIYRSEIALRSIAAKATVGRSCNIQTERTREGNIIFLHIFREQRSTF